MLATRRSHLTSLLPTGIGLSVALVLVGTTVFAIDADARKSRRAKAKVEAPVEETAEEPAPRPPPREMDIGRRVPAKLRAALEEILREEVLDGVTVGFAAKNIDTGAFIASAGGDTLINPASNAKLLTAAAALDTLGPEYRWKTEYYVTGSLKNGVLYGDLVVKGYGDPTVVTERLQRVASELRLLGLHRIKGAVIVDDSYFDAAEEARGWEMEDKPDRAYAAPVSALTFNYNAVAVHLRPGPRRGEPAFVAVDPPVEYVTLEGDVTTQRWVRRLRVGTKKDRFTTKVEVSGAVGYRDRARRIYRRVWDPPRYFASALITFLRQQGVAVRHRIAKGKVPADARLVYVDRSAALTQVVSDLNHYSNNIIAETIIKTLGAETTQTPGSFDAGLMVVRDYASRELGFAEGTYTFGNGSGLNDVNRVTANQVVSLLEHMDRDFEVGTEFVGSLAVAGTRGTIRHRMRGGAAERRLRAKTGTLSGVSALSGYVANPRGETIAFAILVEGYQRPTSVVDIWDIQNRIGESLASDGESYWDDVEQAEAVALDNVKLENGGAAREAEKGGAP